MEEKWHAQSWQQALKILGSDFEQGLSENEADKRRKKSGPNVLPREIPLSKVKIFLEQFKSPLVYILLAAGVVVLFFAKFTDAIVIFGAVLLNTAVGFWQENKSTDALKKLRKVVKIEAEVIRDGQRKKIDAKDLVKGDILNLSSGERVPADGRLIETQDLRINEASLTGEWLAAEKNTKVLAPKTGLADRDNMVYMGSIVELGKGRVVVTGVGAGDEGTELGKVAGMLKETVEEKTPLQKKLAKLSKTIGLLVVLACIFIFFGGIAKNRDFLQMFETAVAVAVAAIPEGLPVALTVILALGMKRILNKKGLVRKLLAAETLGSTSIICSDKTLTLTQGKMEVSETVTFNSDISATPKKKWRQVFGEQVGGAGVGANSDQVLLMTIAALSNEAFVENPEDPHPLWKVRGRPTDRALLLGAAEVGILKPELEKDFSKIDEIPFNPENKFIASLYKTPKNTMLYAIGAPERIISLCAITKTAANRSNKILQNLTNQGLRVIAVAFKKHAKSQTFEVKDLTFVGFIGLKDPLRPEARQAIKLTRNAGMRPILVTGDHLFTAQAVAKELGIKTKANNIILGKELDELSDEALGKRLKNIEIYARVEPRHKMRIIEAWQSKGEVVAMTGDGVNDAPALKKADIGVALGSGTDVAKEASDLILLTDNFNVIVAAVEEGRTIIDNIRKVITYLLSDSFTEVILIGVSLILGWPLPVLAVQILWVNLIEDGPLALVLAFEPKEKDVMNRKPQGHDTSLFTKEMKVLIFIIGLITDILLLGLFFWLLKYSGYEVPHIRSIMFAALTIDSIFYIFSCKSLRRNLWHINPFSNKFLVLAWIFGVIALVAAIYVPILQTLLKTVPLNFFDWQLVLGLGLFNILLIEITKWYFITKKQKL